MLLVSLSGFATAVSALDSTNGPENGGVVVTDGTTDGGSASTSVSTNSTWSNFVRWFVGVTDLDSLASQSVGWTLLHIGLVLVGLLMIAAGPSIYRLLKARLAATKLSRTSYQPWGIRMIGGALIVLAFIV
jgi:hypothetical protein